MLTTDIIQHSVSTIGLHGAGRVFFCLFSSKKTTTPLPSIGYTQSLSEDFPCRYFTAKERDKETGYHYFGARYYWSSVLTGWLSVDRYASKYPSISPYAYCAWNPIRLTDPSGDSVVLNGDAKLINYAVSDMQKRTKNLQLSVNEKGAVSYSGKPVTEEEVYMAGIIDNKQVKVNIFLQKDSKIRDNIEMFEGACDAFDGSDVYKDNQGNLKANAIQYVNVLAMMSLDPSKSGDCMWHAVSEAFEGANMALDLGHSVRFNDPDYWYVYNISHNNANYRFCGNVSGFGFNPEKIVYTIDRF